MRRRIEQWQSVLATVLSVIVATPFLFLSCVSCDHLGQRRGDESQTGRPNTQADATKTSSPSDQNDAPVTASPESDASTTLDEDDLLDDAVTAQLREGHRQGEDGDLAALHARPGTVDFQRAVFPGETNEVPDAIRRHMSKSFGRFLECARAHLENPDSLPRVVVEFTIGIDGRVTDAVAEGPQPYAGCVSSVIAQIRFSLPTQESIRVRYPVYP